MTEVEMRQLKVQVYGAVMKTIARRLPETSFGIQRYQFARFLLDEATLDLSASDKMRLGLGAAKG